MVSDAALEEDKTISRDLLKRKQVKILKALNYESENFNFTAED